MSAPAIQIKGASRLSNLFPQTSVLAEWATERATCITGDDIRETKNRADVIGKLLAMTPVGDESWALRLAAEYRSKVDHSALPRDIADEVRWRAVALFYRKYERAPTLRLPATSVETLSAVGVDDIIHDVYAAINSSRAGFWLKIYQIIYD